MARKIIAVDFDGCLVTDRFPNIGEPIPETVAAVKAAIARGDKVILWSCRMGRNLTTAVLYCRDYLGIVFDAVNENLPEVIARFGSDCRKIYADEYWDDKAVQVGATRAGHRALD